MATNDDRPTWDEPVEELLGEVLHEHAPKDGDTPTNEPRAQAWRKEWPNRPSYVLHLQMQDGNNSADFDRAGWTDLRALCDTVLARLEGGIDGSQ